MKICVLFPGIGYTNDRPLLYYAGKMMVSHGHELIRLDYHDLPGKVKGDRERMLEAFNIATEQIADRLKEVDWDKYDEILFTGKSIGTAVAANYGKVKGLKVPYVFLTPLVETFLYTTPATGIAFHGNSDPWAETKTLIRVCDENSTPVTVYEGANHSLETGNVLRDIEIASDVMNKIREYVKL